MNKFFSILVISLVASISLVAETKVFSSKDFSSTVKIVEKNKVITTIGAGRVTSNERFFIDKDTKYNLKITARKVKGSPDFYCHIGFILCDEGMVELQPVFYRAEYYTESTIVNDVKENSNIIVINKPKGMVVHPASGVYENTLVNALLYHTPIGYRISIHRTQNAL